MTYFLEVLSLRHIIDTGSCARDVTVQIVGFLRCRGSSLLVVKTTGGIGFCHQVVLPVMYGFELLLLATDWVLHSLQLVERSLKYQNDIILTSRVMIQRQIDVGLMHMMSMRCQFLHSKTCNNSEKFN